MATASRGALAALARVRSGSNNNDRRVENLEDELRREMDPSRRKEAHGQRVVAALRRMFPAPTTYLQQSSFDSGTFRIRTPGYYLLTENVEFDPPETTTPTPEYPFPPFQLGFFCAISVECPDVILDLGGHVLQQSKKHALTQRFHALVELSDQPFEHRQGPSEFGSTVVAANRCLVTNGYLGRSSHHGIHSAGRPTNVVIQDLVIYDFEVAGIHLNGANKCVINRVHVGPSRQDIPVMATFSQARFLLPTLRTMVGTGSTWRGKNARTILSDLESALDAVQVEVLEQGVTTNPLFKNEARNTDGNVYGVVIHGLGVVVNDLLESVHPDTAAKDVILSEVCVEGIVSTPQEIIALELGVDQPDGGYGGSGKVHTGPVGDVLDILSVVSDSGAYRPNVLSEAQFLAAKYSKGTAKASSSILAWAESNVGDFETARQGYKLVGFGDAMHHVQKGSFGILVSNATNVDVVNATLCELHNKNSVGRNERAEAPHSAATDHVFRGDHMVGVTVSGAKEVTLSGIRVMNATARNTKGLDIRGDCSLTCENIDVFGLTSAIAPATPMCVDSRTSITNGKGHLPVQVRQ